MDNRCITILQMYKEVQILKERYSKDISYFEYALQSGCGGSLDKLLRLKAEYKALCEVSHNLHKIIADDFNYYF